MGFPRHFLFAPRIDEELRKHYGNRTKVSAATRMLPMYRFPDLFRAADALGSDYKIIHQITSRHEEPLDSILSTSGGAHYNRKLNLAGSNPRQVDYDETEYFPEESFWIILHQETQQKYILRARNVYQMTFIEVVSSSNELAQSFLDTVITLANEHSVYRNKVFEIRFEPSGQEYGTDHEQAFQVHFLKRHGIDDDEIILEDEVRSLIERNVIDFHRRRDQLVELGVPRKRGLLLYGPPGNGKTYTCKYLAGCLEDATTIFAAGTALVQIRTIFNVARLFQPSLIVLEDIDLVYSDRQINPYSPQLGSLMDELDGAADADNLIVMLTTNSIERVESAIKDRPGRVSQCIEIPNPGPKLRRLYLKSLLREFQDDQLDYNELVTLTDGASHAFIKEFVYRSIQIASERANSDGQFDLLNEDFQTSQHEMTQQGGKAGRSIIGFRATSSTNSTQ
ncbi:MAG: ATP-binding protein [Planctomycetaceae bacterium]|nr:ATP-binding protein [Planctomycetaceae bacterium]